MVSNGQAATATVFNNAFASKIDDNTLVGVQSLNNAGSDAVDDLQKSVEQLFSAVGTFENEAAPNDYSSSNYVADGDDRRVAIGKLDAQVKNNSDDIADHEARVYTLETDVGAHTTQLAGLTNVTNDAQLKRAAGDFATFTEKTTPVGNDLVLIEDSADSGNKKKLKLSNMIGGGGSTVTPTVQIFTSGSGSYVSPTSPAPAYLIVEVMGSGGGGSGSSTSAANDGFNGGPGSNSTFGTSLLVAGGGAGGYGGSTQVGGVGGTISSSSPAVDLGSVAGSNGEGVQESAVAGIYFKGGSGAASFLAGGGSGGQSLGAGLSPAANSGAGGGGGGGVSTGITGSGGGSGGYVKAIVAPGTYSYSVGAAGAAGAAGTGGLAGGAGGAGLIIVTEVY